MWKEEIPNEIVNLDVSNSWQDTDVLSKIIKKNGDIFTDFIHRASIASLNKNELLYILKLAFKAHFKAHVLKLAFSRKAKRTQNRITSQ